MYDLGDQEFLKSILAPGFWLLCPMSLLAVPIVLFVLFNVFACFSYGSEGAGRLIENFRGLKKEKTPNESYTQHFQRQNFKKIQSAVWWGDASYKEVCWPDVVSCRF